MNSEPRGTFADGYDLGLQDAAEGKPRRHKRPQARWQGREAGFFRWGYAEGYDDGVDRKAAERVTR